MSMMPAVLARNSTAVMTSDASVIALFRFQGVKWVSVSGVMVVRVGVIRSRWII